MAESEYTNYFNDPSGLQIISPVLTNLARMYRPAGFVYDKVASYIPVNTISGQYPVFDPETFFQDPGNTEVDDRAPTPEIHTKFGTEFYNVKFHRRKISISLEERSNANQALRLEFAKTQQLLDIMAIARETRLAKKLQGPDNGGSLELNSVAPTTPWDEGSATTSSIRTDIDKAKLKVRESTGRMPNTIILDHEIAMAIARDPLVVQILQYQMGAQIIARGEYALPPTLFGLNVIETFAMSGSGGDGDSTVGLSSIWGNKAIVCYVDPNAQWGIPSVAYSFRGFIRGSEGPTEDNSALPGGINASAPGFALVDRWQTPDPPVEHIRAWESVDEKVVAPGLGYEIKECLKTFI